MQASLSQRYRSVRQQTMALAEPLSEADLTIQASEFASPGKWHLGHTTWFFEEFLLRARPGFRAIDERYRFLFNSYYETIGARQPQARRGLLSRPSLSQVLAYRQHVDAEMLALCEVASAEQQSLIELGLHHEQQHQELFLTDILHTLSHNPLLPAYREAGSSLERVAGLKASLPANGDRRAADKGRDRSTGIDDVARWQRFDGGLVTMGHQTAGFAYDNETPAHQVFLRPYRLARDLVTWRDYLAFIEDGGYRDPLLWLSDGWRQVQTSGWHAPEYVSAESPSQAFTLEGLQAIGPDSPVTHLSFFEADAFARWCGCRLPTEAEWEHAARGLLLEGSFVESGRLRPGPVAAEQSQAALRQMFGEVWQWTASAYLAYPGYRPSAGAIGEYNGKFMNGQYVLRGGSIATPQSHLRVTYRNFFYPHQRWQFTGVRLAKDD